MSKSRANELLQHLIFEMEKLWKGKPSDIKCATDAYKLCEDIAAEAKKEN